MGISAARELATIGFTQNVNDDSPDYPINEIMSTLKPDTRLSTASIPSARISSGEKWSLFESLTGDPAELARQVVTIGPEKALARCPVRKFGGMLSVERAEQERLEAVIDIVEERIASGATTPTCRCIRTSRVREDIHSNQPRGSPWTRTSMHEIRIRRAIFQGGAICCCLPFHSRCISHGLATSGDIREFRCRPGA